MPLDRPRPNVLTHNGARTHLSISRDLTEKLHLFSRKNGVTMFMTLLAAYQTLLYRYTGQDDICTGTSITSRNRPELRDLISLFANNLVLRSDLSGNPTFLEVLKRTRKMALGACAHQDIPFEKLKEVKEIVRAPLRGYLQTFLGQFDTLNPYKEEKKQIQDVLENNKESLIAFAFEKYFAMNSLMGSQRKCAAMIECLHSLGVKEVACLLDFGLEFDQVMAGLEKLNELRKYFEPHNQVTV